MRLDHVHINALGVFLPEWVSAQQAVENGLVDADVIADSGYIGAYLAGDIPALDMAVSAGRSALDRSGRDPQDIGLHVHTATFHQGPGGWYPPAYVERELGMADPSAMFLRQGCCGLLSALEVAVGQMTGAAAVELALLTTGENAASESLDRWRDFSPSFIVSDGGAAVLLSSEGGFAQVRSLCSGVLNELEGWQRGAEPLVQGPAGEKYTMDERVRQFLEGELSLSDILRRLAEFGLEIMHRSLVDADLNVADLAWVVSPNMERRMVEWSIMQQLGLPMERSSWTYGREVGHMASADVFVSLDHLLRSGRLSVGDNVLLTAQGPGWLCSSSVITITEIPAWAA